MRIIWRGDPNKVKVYRKECENCMTVFEFDETEIEKYSFPIPNVFNTSRVYTVIYCPVCNKEIQVY